MQKDGKWEDNRIGSFLWQRRPWAREMLAYKEVIIAVAHQGVGGRTKKILRKCGWCL